VAWHAQRRAYTLRRDIVAEVLLQIGLIQAVCGAPVRSGVPLSQRYGAVVSCGQWGKQDHLLISGYVLTAP